MNQDNNSFGKFIQAYMELHDISKATVSEVLDESEQTIEAILNDDVYLSKRSVAILADLFDLPFDYLSIIQDWSWKSYQEERDK